MQRRAPEAQERHQGRYLRIHLSRNTQTSAGLSSAPRASELAPHTKPLYAYLAFVYSSLSSKEAWRHRKKGYARAAFTDAWERYAVIDVNGDVCKTPPKTTVPNVTTGQTLSSNGHSGTDGSRLSPDGTVVSRLSEGPNPNGTAGCHVVTDDTDGKEGFSETPVHDEGGAVDGGDDTCLL